MNRNNKLALLGAVLLIAISLFVQGADWDDIDEDATTTACEGTWFTNFNCSNLSDNDWDTYGYGAVNVSGKANHYFNATKPSNANNLRIEVRYDLSGSDYRNFTIGNHTSCWGKDPIEIRMHSLNPSGNPVMHLYCMNSTEWELVFNGNDDSGSGFIYEYSLHWNISGVTRGSEFIAEHNVAETLNDSIYEVVNAYNRTWLQFDGIDDNITITDSDELDGHNETSWSFWIYPHSVETNNEGILNKWINTGGNKAWTLYYTATAGGIVVAISDNGTSADSQSYGAYGLINNTWQHVVITFDNGQLRYYKDGVFRSNFTLDTESIYNSPTDMKVGYNFQNTYFNGSLAEIRIYNVTLTQDNITDLYNNGRVTNMSLIQTDLKFYMPLNENNGTIAYDIKNWNNGTFEGSPIWKNDSINITLSNQTDYTLSGTSFTLLNQNYDRSWLRLSQNTTGLASSINISFIAPENNTIWGNTTNLNFSASVNTTYDLDYCNFTINQTNYQNSTNLANGSITSTTNVTFLVNGMYFWNITCMDLNGGVDYSSGNYNFTIYNVAPNLTITFPQTGDNLYGTSPAITWTLIDLDNTLTNISIDEVLVVENIPGTNSTFEIDTTTYTETTHHIRMTTCENDTIDLQCETENHSFVIDQPEYGGGGTPGGGGGLVPDDDDDCIPDWECTSWSFCENDTQTRTCTDDNNCGITEDKPLETRDCTVISNIIEDTKDKLRGTKEELVKYIVAEEKTILDKIKNFVLKVLYNILEWLDG